MCGQRSSPGRRRHDGVVTEFERQVGEQQGGVDVADVIGGEDDRAFHVAQMLHPPHGGGGNEPCDRAGEVVHDHGAGQAGRVAPGPFVVVLEAELAFGIGAVNRGRPRRGGRGQADQLPARPTPIAAPWSPTESTISGRPPS